MGERVRAVASRMRHRSGAMAGGVRRHPFRTVLAAGMLVFVVLPLVALGWVRWSARGNTYSEASVPHAPVGLVLGAGLRPDGTPTSFLEARLAVAAD